ncbi:MAG: PaaI family thioesterase [Xanthobacteraceae bacterium]|nr:PaaI family thioesterase [Xanthobacteraceae bacterium]
MTHPARIPPRHPFGDTIKLRIDEQGSGRSLCSVEIVPDLHHNPHRIAHGAVLYALADTGMGVALYPTLAETETCATIEIKMSYFRAVPSGVVHCETTLVNRGRTIANLDSRLYVGDTLVAQANGNYAILKPRTEAAVKAS